MIGIGFWMVSSGSVGIMNIGFFSQTSSTDARWLIYALFLFLGLYVALYGITEHYKSMKKKFSTLYYAPPIFLSLLGSLLVYAILYKKDKELGTELAWVGFLAWMVPVAINLAIFALL